MEKAGSRWRNPAAILPAILLAGLSFPAVTVADDASQRGDLQGAWKADGSAAEADTWEFETKGETLRVTHSAGDRKVAEFECNTMGKECDGKSGKVSMWFSGPKLVVLETKGHDVIKRRFEVSNPEMLEVEVIPIVPDGKAETLHFRRLAK